jgi:hypothetical protein
MNIHLYHKRHKITGLNYFGKTSQDPFSYGGSGRYWQDHLKIHGDDVETIRVWSFTELEECVEFALSFSKENNIVESSDWANLRPENGLDGGDTFKYMSEERLEEIRQKRIIGGLKQYDNNDRRKIQSENAKTQWKNIDSDTRKSINEKISISKLSKTQEELDEINRKRRETESKRTPEFNQSIQKRRLETIRKNLPNMPLIECPHCGKKSRSGSNMTRFHFYNCKFKNKG